MAYKVRINYCVKLKRNNIKEYHEDSKKETIISSEKELRKASWEKMVIKTNFEMQM